MLLASTFDKPGIDYDELAGSDDIGTYPIDPSPSPLLPSGVSVETVARLMHDELLHNAEFTKQVRLVAALQELLKFRSKTTPNGKSSHPNSKPTDKLMCFSLSCQSPASRLLHSTG